MSWMGINLAIAPYGWCMGDDHDRLLVSQAWDPHFLEAENLIDDIETCLTSVRQSWEDVRHIALVQGPGNYTGLRLSATTVNFLAQILSIPLISVPTFEWIGAHFSAFSGTYLGVTPAVQGQINAQLLGVRHDSTVEALSELVAMNGVEFERFLRQFHVPFSVAGVLPLEFITMIESYPLIKWMPLQLDVRHLGPLAARLSSKAGSFVSPLYFHQAVRTVPNKVG